HWPGVSNFCEVDWLWKLVSRASIISLLWTRPNTWHWSLCDARILEVVQENPKLNAVKARQAQDYSKNQIGLGKIMTHSSSRNYQTDIDSALRLKRTSELVSAFISGNPITREEIPAL